MRCWFAPHDLPIGAKTWDAIDAAIRVRDKVLLILSKNAVDSDWVEYEVSKAFAEERRKQVVLFPVRIDQTVMTTEKPWAGHGDEGDHVLRHCGLQLEDSRWVTDRGRVVNV